MMKKRQGKQKITKGYLAFAMGVKARKMFVKMESIHRGTSVNDEASASMTASPALCHLIIRNNALCLAQLSLHELSCCPFTACVILIMIP